MGEFEIKVESDSIFTVEAAYGPKGDKGDTGFPGDNPDVFDYTLRLSEPIHSQFKLYYDGNWFSPEWIVVAAAGQSNSLGNSYATDGDKTGEGEVWSWNGTEIVEATLGELPFNDSGSVNNAAFHAAHRISVEQQRPVFLILHGVPGTTIGTWLPPYANNSNIPGTNWTDLNTKINAAFAACATELWGKDTIEVLLWQQGEGEYALGPLYSLSTDRYPALLTGFFEADWAGPDMQVIVGQCLPQSAGGTAWQSNEEWAKMLNWPRVHIAVGTGLVTTGHDSGQIVHYSGASLQELGYRMADIYNGVSTGLTSDAIYKAADAVGGTFWKERLYSRLIDLTFSASTSHPQTITVPTPQAGVPVVFEVDGVRSEVISGGSAASYTLESADPAHVIIWYPADAMVDQKPGVSVVASTYTGRLRSFQMDKTAQLASLYLSSQPELQHSVRPADWPRSLTTFRINASPLIRFDDFVAPDMPADLTILTFTSTTPVPVWVREAVEYENTKRDNSITTVTFGTNYGSVGELPPPSDAPMPIEALLSNATVAGRTYVPLTQILGRSYNAATDDFAVLLSAVMDDIFDAGLTIVDDVGLSLRWVTPIICGDVFDVDFGKAKIIKVLSNTSVGNAAIRNTDIEVPMTKFRWIGGTIRELNNTVTGTLMRINAEEVELSHLDAEFHGGIGVSLNSTDTGSIIETHNKIVSTETAEGSGDACVRIGGGANRISHSNYYVSDEDANPISTNTSPSGALPNRNTNNMITSGNVIKTNGRLVGAVGASSNPAAANSTHTGLHSNLTFENIRGTCGQLFRLCFDDVAAGLRADNITLRDIKGQFQSWTRSIAAEIVGQNSGSIGRVTLDDIVCPDPLRPFGLVLNAPGATINGDNLKFTGGRNALRILRPEAGSITLNNSEFIATNTNLTFDDDYADDEDVGVTDRRDPIRIENATRNARTFISFSAVGTDGQQIVIGATTYTLRNTVGAAYSVKVGATKEDTAANLTAAINAGAGSGTLYGTGTSAHPSVTATIPKPTKLYRIAILAIATGAAGNGIAVTVPASASYKNATTVGGYTPTGRLQIYLTGKTIIRGVYSPTISGTPTPMSGINCTADNVDFIIEDLEVYKTPGATNTWAITAATGCTVRIKSLSGDVDNLGVTGGATVLPWVDESTAQLYNGTPVNISGGIAALKWRNVNVLDTESNASTDDVDGFTIPAGTKPGDVFMVRANSNNRDITYRHSKAQTAPNYSIKTATGLDRTLTLNSQFISFMWTGWDLVEIASSRSQIITPEDYGAMGDGTTDDRAAIIAADAAAAALGVAVTFRKGRTYAVAGSITRLASWIGGGKIKRTASGSNNFIICGADNLNADVEINANFLGQAAFYSTRDGTTTASGFIARNATTSGVRIVDANDCTIRGTVFDTYNKGVLVLADTQDVTGLIIDVEVDQTAIGLLAVQGCISIQGTEVDHAIKDPSNILYGVLAPQVKAVCRMIESDSFSSTGIAFESIYGIVGGNFDVTTYGGLIGVSFNDSYGSVLQAAIYGPDQDGLEMRGSHDSIANFTVYQGRGGTAPSCGVRMSLGKRMTANGAWVTKLSEGSSDYPFWLNGCQDCTLTGVGIRLDNGLTYGINLGSSNCRVAVKAMSAAGVTVTQALRINDTYQATGSEGSYIGGPGSCDGMILDGCDFGATTYGIYGVTVDPVAGMVITGRTKFRNTGAAIQNSTQISMSVEGGSTFAVWPAAFPLTHPISWMTAQNLAAGSAGSLFDAKGAGDPRGAVTALMGSTWIDTASGIAYLKRSGTDTSGWQEFGDQARLPFLMPPSGEYISGASVGSGTPTTVVMVADRVQLYAFRPRRTFTTDMASINVTAGAASSFVKAVVYSADANGRPANLLLESAAMDTSGTGQKDAAISPTLTFNAGETYFIGVKGTGTPTITAFLGSSVPALNGGGFSASAKTILNKSASYASAAPSTWTYSGSELGSGNAAMILWRVA